MIGAKILRTAEGVSKRMGDGGMHARTLPISVASHKSKSLQT